MPANVVRQRSIEEELDDLLNEDEFTLKGLHELLHQAAPAVLTTERPPSPLSQHQRGHKVQHQRSKPRRESWKGHEAQRQLLKETD